MLLPTIFPTAMSALPLYAATAEAASSGNDVPIATIVSPISASLTFQSLAIVIAPSTTSFPPTASPRQPSITRETAIHVFIFGFSRSSLLSSCHE